MGDPVIVDDGGSTRIKPVAWHWRSARSTASAGQVEDTAKAPFTRGSDHTCINTRRSQGSDHCQGETGPFTFPFARSSTNLKISSGSESAMSRGGSSHRRKTVNHGFGHRQMNRHRGIQAQQGQKEASVYRLERGADQGRYRSTGPWS